LRKKRQIFAGRRVKTFLGRFFVYFYIDLKGWMPFVTIEFTKKRKELFLP